MTDWQPIESYPHTAVEGDYVRVDGDKYVVLKPGERVTVATPEALQRFVEARLAV